jgi:hypothetical protein
LQASSCRIYGGQSGTETGLSPHTSVSPSHAIPPMLYTLLSITGALLPYKFTAILSNMFKELHTPLLLKYYLDNVLFTVIYFENEARNFFSFTRVPWS